MTRSYWIEHSIDETPARAARPDRVIWAEPLERPWAGEAEARYQQGDFLLEPV